ncbi:uncharacterized protein LOC104266427 [Ciona intestinalis]
MAESTPLSVKDRIRAMQVLSSDNVAPKSNEVMYMSPTSIPVKGKDEKPRLELENLDLIEESIYNGTVDDVVAYMSPKHQVLSPTSDPDLFKMVDMTELHESPTRNLSKQKQPEIPKSVPLQSSAEKPDLPKLLKPNHKSHSTIKDRFNQLDLPKKQRRISDHVFEAIPEPEDPYIEAADATTSPTFRKKVQLRHVSNASDDVSVTSPKSPGQSNGTKKQSLLVQRGDLLYNSFISIPDKNDGATTDKSNDRKTSLPGAMETGSQQSEVYLELESKDEAAEATEDRLEEMGAKLTQHKIFGQKKAQRNVDSTPRDDHVTVTNPTDGRSTTVRLRKPKDVFQERPISMPFAPPPDPPKKISPSPLAIEPPEVPPHGHKPGHRPLPAPPIISSNPRIPEPQEEDVDKKILQRKTSMPDNPPPSPPSPQKPPPLLPKNPNIFAPKLPFRPPSPYLRNSIPELSFSPPGSPIAPALPERNQVSPKRPISTPERPTSDISSDTPERKIHPIAQMIKLRKIAGSAENVRPKTTNKAFRSNSRLATSELPPIPVFSTSESVPNLSTKPSPEIKPKPAGLTKTPTRNMFQEKLKTSPTKSKVAAKLSSLHPVTGQRQTNVLNHESDRSPLKMPTKPPPKPPAKPENAFSNANGSAVVDAFPRSPSKPSIRDPMPLPMLSSKPRFSELKTTEDKGDRGLQMLPIRKHPAKRDGYTLHLLQNLKLEKSKSLEKDSAQSPNETTPPELYAIIPDPVPRQDEAQTPEPSPTIDLPQLKPTQQPRPIRSPRIKAKPRPTAPPPPRPVGPPPQRPITADVSPTNKPDKPRKPSTDSVKTPPARPPPPSAQKIFASKIRPKRSDTELHISPIKLPSPLKTKVTSSPVLQYPEQPKITSEQAFVDVEDVTYSAIPDWSGDSFSTNTSEDNSFTESVGGAKETPKKKKLSLGNLASSVSTLRMKLGRHKSRDVIAEASPYSAASDVESKGFEGVAEGVYAGIDDYSVNYNENWNSNETSDYKGDVYLAATENRSFVYAELDHTNFVDDGY